MALTLDAPALHVPVAVSDTIFPKSKATSAALWRFDLQNPLLALDDAAHAGTSRGSVFFRMNARDTDNRPIYVAPEFRSRHLGGPQFERVIERGHVVGSSRSLNRGLAVSLNDVMAELGPELDIRCAVNKDCTLSFSRLSDGHPLDTVDTAKKLAEVVRERIRLGTWPHGDMAVAPRVIPLPNTRVTFGVHVGSATFPNVTAAIRFLASYAEPEHRANRDGVDQFGDDMNLTAIVDAARIGSPSRLASLCVSVTRKIEGSGRRTDGGVPSFNHVEGADPNRWYYQSDTGIPSLGVVSLQGSGKSGPVTVRCWGKDLVEFPSEHGIAPLIIQYNGRDPFSADFALGKFRSGTVSHVHGTIFAPPSSEGNVLNVPWDAFQQPRRGVQIEDLKKWSRIDNGMETARAEAYVGANEQSFCLQFRVRSVDGCTFSAHDNGIQIGAVGRGRVQFDVIATPMEKAGSTEVFGTNDSRLAAIRIVNMSLAHLTRHLTQEPVLNWLPA